MQKLHQKRYLPSSGRIPECEMPDVDTGLGRTLP